jgi:hypothetical protein
LKEYYTSRTEGEWPGGEVYEEYNKDGANSNCKKRNLETRINGLLAQLSGNTASNDGETTCRVDVS